MLSKTFILNGGGVRMRNLRLKNLSCVVIVTIFILVLCIPIKIFNMNICADLTDPGTLIPHGSIYINGNGDFTNTKGVLSGSGALYDPFIIEQWDINASITYGIVIKNTDAYFIIRNIWVHDGGWQNTGIYFFNVKNGKIESSRISNNWFGINIQSSSDNYITLNNISQNGYGLWLINSNDNSIIYNVMDSTKNTCIYLEDSSNNSIIGNNVSNSGDNGIEINVWSMDNQIYHNNIISNHRNNGQDKQINQWDNGYPSGGNYWDDYTGVDFFKGQNQDQPGNDGIGDTPYIIICFKNLSQDRYPLMSPWTPRLQLNTDLDPDTLNLKSKGRWITCYITLNSPYDINDIDISTVLLEDTIPAEWGDIQGDTLMVKFDRSDVEDMLSPGTYNLKVTGELSDGTKFEGYSDEIRVIEPP
jgi:parallel beta-helix repeat protein